MVHHFAVTASLLAIALVVVWLCSLGLWAMRDPFQRLQFNSPVVTIAAFCVLVAVWLEDPAWQSKIKMTIIAVLLAVMNSVLSHGTARAIRIRQLDRWPPSPDEKIPVYGNKGIAGAPPFAPRDSDPSSASSSGKPSSGKRSSRKPSSGER